MKKINDRTTVSLSRKAMDELNKFGYHTAKVLCKNIRNVSTTEIVLVVTQLAKDELYGNKPKNVVDVKKENGQSEHKQG